jgi:hypothetical protein
VHVLSILLVDVTVIYEIASSEILFYLELIITTPKATQYDPACNNPSNAVVGLCTMALWHYGTMQ